MKERLGDYMLDKRIGRGGMAEVWRARAVAGPLEGRTVALKRLLPEHAQNPMVVHLFAGEADVLQSLRHPSIITVLETGCESDTYYIVMEYVDGRDLSELLRMCAERRIRLPIDVACHVAYMVARALDHAHRARLPSGEPLGLVHCDVTPSNIFISSKGEVLLGDFGVAQTHASPIERHIIAGKVAYLAPEQIEGERVSPATDVFTLGAVLYEMLTGEPAFDGATGREVMRRIVEGPTPRPSRLRPEVDPRLDAVVQRAMAVPRSTAAENGFGTALMRAFTRRPARYASAAELAAELQPLYDPQIGTADAVASVLRGLFRQGQRRRSTNLGKRSVKL